MKIKIKEQSIELKWKARAMLIWESINNGKMFNIETFTDIYTFFYATLLANGLSEDVSFNDFLEWTDETPDAVTSFTGWLEAQSATMSEVVPDAKKKKGAR